MKSNKKHIFGGKYHLGFLAAIFVFVFSVSSSAQTTLVNWNFPNAPDDTVADGGIAANATQTISTVGAGSAFSYSAGVTTQAISATTWNTGNGTKYWLISFTTTGYNSITISSAQKSSNTGPRDFKIQYSLDNSIWTDVTTVPAVANDAGTPWAGTVTDVALPAAANNQAIVYIRWIMTSDLAVGGAAVASGGTSRIDDITVRGISTSAANAFIIGKVKDSNGRGISKAVVTLTGGSLTEPKQVLTNIFGFYNFSVPAGESYVVTVSSRLHRFAAPSRIVNLDDNVTDIDFGANPR